MNNRLAFRKAAVAGVALLALAVQAAERRPASGDPAPTALGISREGEPIGLEQGGGRVQVVTFWASWCGPCLKELPVLEGLQRTAKDRVRVVAVNIEDPARFRVLAEKLSSLSLTLANDGNKSASGSYGVKGIPHLVIIGKDGKIIAVHRGYSEDAIDRILAEINGALAAL